MADRERLYRALNEITETIGYLHNQVKTVLRDTPDQRERQKRVSEIIQRRPKSYHVFMKTIGNMSEAERRTIRFGTYRLLWEEFPPRLDLEENVGNFDNPGDGKVYDDLSVQQVKQILKAFYDAWHEATISSGGATPMSPNILRKVGKLPDMAKICLILRGMKQERLLDNFCEESRDDKNLPLKPEALRSIFDQDDHDYVETFCTEQFRAICRTWHEGVHIKVADAEPLPLVSVYEYGKGSYGSVTRVKDVFTDVLYACKEQISSEARAHLLREIARLKKLGHRHIVQFVKSYQRRDRYGILLKPAATTDLKKLLDRYKRNGLDFDRDARDRRRDRVLLKPLLLTAFGCLSRGLAHIHNCNIRHKDIKPANILFEKAKDPSPARFLWADFGLAHDFGDTGNSKTVSKNRHRYSPRYAAPEIMEQYEARKASGEVINDDTDDEEEEEEEAPKHTPDQPNGVQGKLIGHGRSSDIYSFGIVFLEILSYLIAEGPEASIPRDFEDCMPFWKNIKGLQGWAHKQIQRLPPKDPLVFLFRIGSKMIAHEATDRPFISDVVQDLTNANPVYFCAACLQESQEPISQAVIAEQQVIEGLDKANLLLHHVNSHEQKSPHEVEDIEQPLDEFSGQGEHRRASRASLYQNGKEPVAKRSSLRSPSRRRDRPPSILRFSQATDEIIPDLTLSMISPTMDKAAPHTSLTPLIEP